MNRIPEVIFYYSDYQLINGGCIIGIGKNHDYYINQCTKRNTLKSDFLTNKEKLQMIFDIDKEALKKQFPELYYCILAVLDEDKISTPGDYFKTDNS